MSEAIFRKGLRAAVRGLFTKALTPSDFEESMMKTINRNLKQAWKEGALLCGVGEDELSDDEMTTRDGLISSQYSFIPGFAVAIVENRDSDNPNIDTLFNRVNWWVDRYSEALANGKAMACADSKAKFMYGPTREHCGTCKGLVGRVYRYSTWVKNNAVPPHNWNFECRGGCHCRLEDTDEPLTRGKFPIRLLK